ncbi:MAG: paraquat-inducible protein A [Roseobacter sp.]
MVSMERVEQKPEILNAADLGLVGCRRCSRALPEGTKHCTRCGQRVTRRDTYSLQKVWAFWLFGLMAYIPANLYPMLHTRTLFYVEESTIIGGAVDLMHYGSVGIAIIILVASVAIPVAKFLAIAFLAISVSRRSVVSKEQRQILFEVVEYIGRWSMIDIFVVAIMSSLVQLNILVSISPGPASFFFAVSVIATMLSAQAFDSRLIWDAQRDAAQKDAE